MSGVLERGLKALGVMASRPSHAKKINPDALTAQPVERPVSLAEYIAAMPDEAPVDAGDHEATAEGAAA